MVKLLLIGFDQMGKEYLRGNRHVHLAFADNPDELFGILTTNQVSAIAINREALELFSPDLTHYFRTGAFTAIPIYILNPVTDIKNEIENILSSIKNSGEDGYSQDEEHGRCEDLGGDMALGPATLCHEGFVFRSEKMKQLYLEMKRCARFAKTILLIGETGVGKDKIAYEIHKMAKGVRRSFVYVPIHALSENLIEAELFGYTRGSFTGAVSSKMGKFEAAHQGTLYLPEISDLPESVQLKLLSFVQYRTVMRIGQDPTKHERKIDVLLILATNEDLDTLVANGRIRKDFYHRINVVRLKVPPLRERKEDIQILVEYFVDRFSREFLHEQILIDTEVFEGLMRYDWPGNVRELENAVQRALLVAARKSVRPQEYTILTLADFIEAIEDSRSLDGLRCQMLQARNDSCDYRTAEINFKREYFQQILQRTDGNIRLAAEIARLTPQGLRKILRKIGIEHSSVKQVQRV